MEEPLIMSTQNLLLVPGLLCDRALWQHQSKHLVELAEITVADVTQNDSMASIAEALLIQAPERFALAGLSMGGYVVLEIMRRAPERVTKLALLDTSARADTKEKTKNRMELIDLNLKGRFDQVTPRLLPQLVHPNRYQDRQLTNAIVSMAGRVGQDAFMRQETAIMARPDSRDDLRRITCPTLVLCGRQDTLTPLELHEEMVSRIPNARLAIIEDCGHMSAMEQPQAVTALLRDWLLYS
jgi:pimeloyl-ACP methyl ester carboxylesterase